MAVIIAAAEISGAEAIHPGYGFLAENSEFSTMCEDHGIKFIGASPKNIQLMGDKNEARETMKRFGVPIVPGSKGIVSTEKELQITAKKIGYPLIIKATAGGGGKGMRVVTKETELLSQFNLATHEAKSAFGNGDVYVERFVEEPRHIEIQVLSDKNGNVIHLGERDCSIQRRHQKLIEEAPSPFLTEVLRKKMGQAAIKAAKGIQYEGAGTVEFLVDKNKDFYFMEMNTRIQVEHTVTEMITNIDLIKQQLYIACGDGLSLKQKDIEIRGHAIEFRINAEDYKKNFMPCPGEIELFLPPGGIGVRTDTHAYPGYKIPSHYDSLIGKLIVWGRYREEAIARSKRALSEFIVEGIETTLPFHQKVLSSETFLSGSATTKYIDQYLDDLLA